MDERQNQPTCYGSRGNAQLPFADCYDFTNQWMGLTIELGDYYTSTDAHSVEEFLHTSKR